VRQKSGSFIREYGPAKLFLDDIAEIEAIFASVCKSTSVETAKYEFDSTQELADKTTTKVIHVFTLEGRDPHLSLEFRKLGTSFYCSSDDPLVMGAFYKTETVLKRCLRKPSFLYKGWATFPLSLALGSTGMLLETSVPLALIAFLLLLGWLIWSGYITFARHSVIVLSKRSNHTTFLSRNIDQLVVNILVAVLTAIATLLATAYGPTFLKYLSANS